MQNNREDLISFFENISDCNLHELFLIVHEIKNVLEWDTPSEKLTFECFAGVLWKATEGTHMVVDGRRRILPEDDD